MSSSQVVTKEVINLCWTPGVTSLSLAIDRTLPGTGFFGVTFCDDDISFFPNTLLSSEGLQR
jgi:hypothetical protein